MLVLRHRLPDAAAALTSHAFLHLKFTNEVGTQEEHNAFMEAVKDWAGQKHVKFTDKDERHYHRDTDDNTYDVEMIEARVEDRRVSFTLWEFYDGIDPHHFSILMKLL